jgi:hypothetical protein
VDGMEWINVCIFTYMCVFCGAQGRLNRTKEKVYMMSQLQEVSRNVDTLSLAQPHAYPESGRIRKAVGDGFITEAVFDISNNTGTRV